MSQNRTANSIACAILAAGKGVRMRSTRPKVLHALAGRSMLAHVMGVAGKCAISPMAVVVGPDMDDVAAEVAKLNPQAGIAVQKNQRGTSDAVQAARSLLKAHQGPVIVLYGDTPLVRADTLKALGAALDEGAEIAVLGFRAKDPTGYGRLLLGESGELTAIREEADASAEERMVDLCNSGVIAFAPGRIFQITDQIGNDNAKREYYLTDAVEIARAGGGRVAVVECAEEEVLGVNSRAQLAAAEAVMQARLRRRAMAAGVTLQDPNSVYFSWDTEIGEDVVIEPQVIFGPGVTIASGATIRAFSHVEAAEIGAGAVIGPYARLRPGAKIGRNSRIGNFVEVKNATFGEGAKANHLAYIGDAAIGAAANIGAGTITCNYDGRAKHLTEIGEGAFIGSNSSLVAPVTIGKGAYVGSGSVITDDVRPGALALGRARQTEIPGWSADEKKQHPPGKSGAGKKG